MSVYWTTLSEIGQDLKECETKPQLVNQQCVVYQFKCNLCDTGSYVGYTRGHLYYIITHQTHYEKSDWSRAFNQFTIACELDMINVISAADITFIMSSSTSAWLLSPLECSPQKQNG